MDPKRLVAQLLKDWLDPERQYPQRLPAELNSWYGYTTDGGHSILCLLKKDYVPGQDLTERLLPVPVKTVLRGYEILGGYVVINVPYDPDIGLLTQPGDDEY